MTVAKVTLYTFKATGKGDFPVDMLRYDRCTPKGQEDAFQLTRAMHGGPWAEQTVTLMGYHEPTADRWASFGWTISEPTSEKMDL